MNSRYGGWLTALSFETQSQAPANIKNISRQGVITIQFTDWRCDFFGLDLAVNQYISRDRFASFPAVLKLDYKLIAYPGFVNLQKKPVVGMSHGLSKKTNPDGVYMQIKIGWAKRCSAMHWQGFYQQANRDHFDKRALHCGFLPAFHLSAIRF
jgi:hypothetical protein